MRDNKIEELFFQLIRVAIGKDRCLSHTPSAAEWKLLYDMAKKQSLVGICFAGVQKLVVQQQEPEEMLYLTWMGMVAKIQQRNELLDRRTEEALEFFREKGFACAAMKGQKVAALYKSTSRQGAKSKSDLSHLRQSGDIDLWIGGGRERLYQLSVDMYGELNGLRYHHVHFPLFEDVELEAHSVPSYHSSPILNVRFENFCKLYEPKGAEDELPLAFNRVFIMEHAFQHFCWHGIGLRHVLDIYFVLKHGFSEDERLESLVWIERLGMKRFARGMMWVLRDILQIDEQYLLCEPNAEDGRFVLSEIMQTGNMGHYDIRESACSRQTPIGRYLHSLRRSVYMVKYDWQFMLFNPFVKVYMFAWRCKTARKWKNKRK